ncbi:PEX19 [Sanghuangporus sanghuang]
MSHKSAMQEEDVDDLDDIVEQFHPRKHASTSNAPPQSTSNPSNAPSSSRSESELEPVPLGSRDGPNGPASQLPGNLAKQLTEGMESLMRELAEAHHGPPNEEERKRREAWEKTLIDGMDNVGTDELLDRSSRAKPSELPGSTSEKTVDEFQSSILQAMEKLKDSDSTLHTDASSAAAASDDPLEALLSQLSSGLDESGEDNGDLQDMLETMMQQLMSKEVLYEPLKELHDKFPGYLSENEQKLSSEDKTRYQNQMTRISAIVKIFEDPSYKEDNQEKGTQIVSLMNEMQSFGSPPSEIMGPLPPGLDLGSDGAPKLPDGCTMM